MRSDGSTRPIVGPDTPSGVSGANIPSIEDSTTAPVLSETVAQTGSVQMLREAAQALRARPNGGRVTPRQGAILQALDSGATDAQVARQLGRGVRTVRHDIDELYDLAGFPTGDRSRFSLGAAAVRRGWIPSDAVDRQAVRDALAEFLEQVADWADEDSAEDWLLRFWGRAALDLARAVFQDGEPS